jgi:concanavalin A-like lectin/glucanase superfamily protein
VTRFALVFLTACSFSAHAADPGAPDGGTVTTADGSPLVANCHVHDTSLRLCLDFEDPSLSPVVRDGSSFAHDAATANLVAMPRAGEQAAQFTISSDATIPATPDFVSTPLTIEAWMKPDEVWTASWALLDSQHYGLGVGGGSFACVVGNSIATADARAYAGQWVHLACTNDGDHLTLFVNGSAVGCDNGASVKSTSDLGIGVDFSGGLDNVRLFAAALTPGDVCAHAGASGCSEGCAE